MLNAAQNVVAEHGPRHSHACYYQKMQTIEVHGNKNNSISKYVICPFLIKSNQPRSDKELSWLIIW